MITCAVDKYGLSANEQRLDDDGGGGDDDDAGDGGDGVDDTCSSTIATAQTRIGRVNETEVKKHNDVATVFCQTLVDLISNNLTINGQ